MVSAGWGTGRGFVHSLRLMMINAISQKTQNARIIQGQGDVGVCD
jgi:hypothetical protein